MRTIPLSRDEAELLTDLLMLTDSPHAPELDRMIRQTFGMVPQADELRGRDLDEVRALFFYRLCDRKIARMIHVPPR